MLERSSFLKTGVILVSSQKSGKVEVVRDNLNILVRGLHNTDARARTRKLSRSIHTKNHPEVVE